MAGLDASAEPALRVQISREGHVPVVTLSGELDLTSVEEVRSIVAAALDGEPDRIVFDTSALRFMDSSGIALLLWAAERVPNVELRDPSMIVQRLIELTGLGATLRVLE